MQRGFAAFLDRFGGVVLNGRDTGWRVVADGPGAFRAEPPAGGSRQPGRPTRAAAIEDVARAVLVDAAPAT